MTKQNSLVWFIWMPRWQRNPGEIQSASRSNASFQLWNCLSNTKILIHYSLVAVSHSLEPLPSIPLPLPSLGASLCLHVLPSPVLPDKWILWLLVKKWAMLCTSKKNTSPSVTSLSSWVKTSGQNFCFICHYSLMSDRVSVVPLS